ncbi:DUF1977-domain-containing protein, partial [Saccharata proteae CBS 121410]
SARASGTDAGGSSSAGDTKHRQHHDGSAGRAYTVEQKAAVLRIKPCQPTAFYEILGLEEVKTTCTDAEIKKAYRKLSLLTHPDKNGYEGADEAFKMVSRAFQVLSDTEKKAKYDKFGGDPESRFGAGASAPQSSPFSGFARSAGGGGRGPMFEEEISPEEMFRQFFGGGMGGMGGFGGPFGGGLFDTGPGFVFNLNGGPGIRVHQFGGQRPRRRPATAQNPNPDGPPSISTALSSLLPLLLLFVLPLLSSLFSSSTPSTNGPSMRFDTPAPPYTLGRTSKNLHIPYFLDPSEVEDYSARQFKQLDQKADVRFMGMLNVECEAEHQRQSRLMQEAQGWFFVDEGKMREARGLEMRSCRRLKDM